MALVGLSTLLGGEGSFAVTQNDRGERQFSFTDREASSYPAFPPDSRYAREKRARTAKQEPRTKIEPGAHSDAREGVPPTGQSAGRAAGARDLRTELDDERKDESAALERGDPAMREGKLPGQTSNAPGSTSTSVGSSNFFGTGGTPIYPGDLWGQAKGGDPGD